MVGHGSELRQVGGFISVFLGLSKKEGGEKSRGMKSSSSSASRV